MRKKLIIVYIILCLCFIWGQSMLPRSQSSGESGFLLEQIIHPFEEAVFGRALSTEVQVRKAAHVFEYMMLGLGLTAFFAESCAKKTGSLFLRTMSAGMFAALIDETIQIFSGRGPGISDVWIDGAGVLLGFLLMTIFSAVGRRRSKCTTL